MPSWNPFRTTSARKYIDLIHDASTNNEWPTCDPAVKIKPGDFGKIEREGQFTKHGSIFSHADTKPLADQYVREYRTMKKDYRKIVSESAKGLESGVDPKVNIAGLAEASIKIHLEFGRSAGACLVINEPTTSHLDPVLVQKLAHNHVDLFKDKGMVLVTNVISCPSYAKYFSSNGKKLVSIALLSSIPVPAAPMVSAGGEVGARWWCSTQNGDFEHAHSSSGAFYPLYIAKELRSKARRGSPDSDAPEVEYVFEDAEPPWNPLDDDGNEIMFEDDSSEEE